MRRFTFAAYNVSNDTTALKIIASDAELRKLMNESGVVNFNYCTSDSISFLVLDMKESFNLNKTKLLLAGLSDKSPKLLVLSNIIDGEYQLLDRIFKMEQKKEYLPEEGQVIPLHREAYRRFILTLEIMNDPVLSKEYVAVHGIGKAWPEITQNMKTVGIHEMELYLMDTKQDFDWDTDGKKWGEMPREKEWQTYVAKFQKTDPESKAAEKWNSMKITSMYP